MKRSCLRLGMSNSMPLVDVDSGVLMTTAWQLFHPTSGLPADGRGLKPLAFHHQVHVSLGLGEAAFSGLPANRAVLVRSHAVRNAACLRDHLGHQGSRFGRARRATDL